MPKHIFYEISNMNSEKPQPKPRTMRHAWFTHVAKTRKKMSKGLDKPVAHREAMREASASWPSKKAKLLKKAKRAEKLALLQK